MYFLHNSNSHVCILSLIETAKQNGIAPEDYLKYLFEKAPYAETEND